MGWKAKLLAALVMVGSMVVALPASADVAPTAVAQVFTSDGNPGGFAEWDYDRNFFKVCDRQDDGYSVEGWVYDNDAQMEISHLIDPSHGEGCSGTAEPAGNGKHLSLRVCLLRAGNNNFCGARSIGRG